MYYSDLTHTNIMVGTVFINKIDKFSPSRLGRFLRLETFYSWDVLGLGTF
jgi:hypothetical protein